jgi:HEAT repeat protein
MRQLAFALQDETLPVGLRTRYLTALAFTGDPGITALFRRLLSHEHPHVRRLACLGCGLLQDAKLIPDVSNLLGDLSLEVRTAACLALGVIGGNAALETVATVLVQGEESLRQVAAEVLADFPDEGHETLREGAAFDDILVRRAVVFGLAKVRQPWAEALLDKMQVEDSQWVVRDAAEHALQQLRQPHPAIPAPLPPLANTPWLIAYAGERGRGISSTEAAREMLAQAIKDGSEAQKMAGVSRVSRLGTANEGLISLIYHALYGNQTELRELAYQTLAHLGSAGVSLPSPMQYGFS